MIKVLPNNKKILFVINPISGNGKAKKIFPKIEEYLINSNISYEKVLTQHKGHGIKIAEQAAKRKDLDAIVAVGGDGTLSEVINGLSLTNFDLPVGYIPSGTGNDFAKAMDIPIDPILALEAILKKNIKKIDIGEFSGNYFVNVASMGFDAEVARYANQSKLKVFIGRLVYVIGVIKTLWSFKPSKVDIKIDNKDYAFNNVWLIAVANNRYYGGGMLISPNSINNDGLFDICIIKDVTRVKILKLFPSIFSGNHVKYYPLVEFLQGNEVLIHTDKEMTIQTDGEILYNNELRLKNIKQVLNVI